MTTFFIPGITDAPAVDGTYREMRKQIQQRMGHAPSTRRIVELWTRRGNLDCFTTVGRPDPICGDIVLAIFDMGHHQPFVVYHQPRDGTLSSRCEVLDLNAYAVSEFDP